MLRKIDKWVVNICKHGENVCFGFSTAEGAMDFYEIVCDSCDDDDVSVTIKKKKKKGEK